MRPLFLSQSKALLNSNSYFRHSLVESQLFYIQICVSFVRTNDPEGGSVRWISIEIEELLILKDLYAIKLVLRSHKHRVIRIAVRKYYPQPPLRARSLESAI